MEGSTFEGKFDKSDENKKTRNKWKYLYLKEKKYEDDENKNKRQNLNDCARPNRLSKGESLGPPPPPPRSLKGGTKQMEEKRV